MDRVATQQFGVPGVVLMENASRALLEAAWELLGGRPGPVTIVCGGGNNGGDGLALVRHLHNRGCDVHLLSTKRAEALSGDAAVQARIVEKMGLALTPASPEALQATPGLIVDALLGTGLSSAPRGDAAEMIEAINACRSAQRPVLAVDVPSGLDCDTGRPLGPDCVRADVTVTFVAEKVGFAHGSEWLGKIVVGDIGCPAEAVWQAVREPR